MPLKFGGLSVAVVSTTLNRSSQSASIVEVKKKKKWPPKRGIYHCGNEEK